MLNCLNLQNEVLHVILNRRKSKSQVPVRVVKVLNVSAWNFLKYFLDWSLGSVTEVNVVSVRANYLKVVLFRCVPPY